MKDNQTPLFTVTNLRFVSDFVTFVFCVQLLILIPLDDSGVSTFCRCAARCPLVWTLQAADPYLGEAGREVQGQRRRHRRKDGLHSQRDRNGQGPQLPHPQVLPCRRRAQGEQFASNAVQPSSQPERAGLTGRRPAPVHGSDSASTISCLPLTPECHRRFWTRRPQL